MSTPLTNSSVNLSVLCMYHFTSLLSLHLHHVTVCYSGTGDWDVSYSILLAPSAQTDFTCKYSLQCIIKIVDVLLFLLQCQYYTLRKTLGYPAVALSLGRPVAVDLLGLSPSCSPVAPRRGSYCSRPTQSSRSGRAWGIVELLSLSAFLHSHHHTQLPN